MTPLTAPGSRGVLAPLLGRAVERRLRLPPTTVRYRVNRGVRVPMRDGVDLIADHYAPQTRQPVGTLLLRGPYRRDAPLAGVTAGVYAGRGYHVVLQSTRGTFGSGGTFEPGRNEVDDGADTVDWLCRQDWFTGSFATVGASYLGFTQLALLVEPRPELETAVIVMAPHDFGRAVWGTGSFALADFLTWSFQMARQHRGGWLREMVRSTATPLWVGPALRRLPLGAAARDLLGDQAHFYESWLAHSEVTDDYWRHLQVVDALDESRAPILLISGWPDAFVDQTLEQYRRLRSRGADVTLIVGPWTHGEGGGDAIRESLRWFDGDRQPTPVRIMVTGGGDWRDLPDWPPAHAEWSLHLHPGRLADEPARADGPPSRFVYDPADPTPTIGGRMISVRVAGYRDDTRLATRPDVIAFTGEPLAKDLEVIGTPCVELAHSTDLPWADVFVRISEIDPKGRSRNVSDGYVRLSQERSPLLRLDMDAIAHRFRAGNRIRLIVAGGSFPRFARNLGTGEPVATGTTLARCTHVVTHAGSRLILPIPV
jgi:putative CocE/NonD family hydrolase